MLYLTVTPVFKNFQTLSSFQNPRTLQKSLQNFLKNLFKTLELKVTENQAFQVDIVERRLRWGICPHLRHIRLE